MDEHYSAGHCDSCFEVIRVCEHNNKDGGTLCRRCFKALFLKTLSIGYQKNMSW